MLAIGGRNCFGKFETGLLVPDILIAVYTIRYCFSSSCLFVFVCMCVFHLAGLAELSTHLVRLVVYIESVDARLMGPQENRHRSNMEVQLSVNIGGFGYVVQETVLVCCKEHPTLAGLAVCGIRVESRRFVVVKSTYVVSRCCLLFPCFEQALLVGSLGSVSIPANTHAETVRIYCDRIKALFLYIFSLCPGGDGVRNIDLELSRVDVVPPFYTHCHVFCCCCLAFFCF